MAAPILRPLASLITAATEPLSSTYYPYPLANTLHAARIHMAYRGRTEMLGFKGKKSRLVDWAGFLIMCWGGSFLTSFLVGLPPPQLLSIHPWINYLSVHIILSVLLPTLPAPRTLDTFLPVIDALTRSFPITGAVLTTQSHPNPTIRSNLFFQLILGGLSSSGGGLIASTLNVFSPTWSFGTPPILNAGFWGTMDFWAGVVGAGVFGLLTRSNEGYAPVLARINGGKDTAIMTVLGARSVVVLVLTVLFAGRAVATHWVGGKAVANAKARQVGAGEAFKGNGTAIEMKKRQ